MGAANASITRLFVYVFPCVGPADRSLWRGGAGLSSCPGEALSAPSQALGWAVLCHVPALALLPRGGLCGCPEAEPCLSTAGSLPLRSQIKLQESARCQLQSGPFPLFYCHQILQVAISGISAKGGFDPISFSIAYCFCA